MIGKLFKANNKVLIKKNKYPLQLWLFLLLGLIIRSYNLGCHNIWFDEFKSYVEQIKDAPGYFLYSALLRLWIICFGSTEFVLRSLSLIFGVISILFIYRLGELLFDKKTGLVSAFILSISPIHIWYSQEARAYTLATFLTIFAVYLLVLAIKTGRISFWIGFSMLSILAIYTSPFFLFIIVVAGSLLFFTKNGRLFLKYYLICLVFILSICIPQVFVFLKLKAILGNFYWLPKPKLNTIALTFENFNVGYNATPEIYFFTFIIFFLFFILGIKSWWREKKKELIFLTALLFIPIIITYLISQAMSISIYLDRQLMLFSPFYYIIIAAGLAKIEVRCIKIAIYFSISVPIGICLNNYYSYRMPAPLYHHIGVPVKKPVKPAMDYINNKFEEEDMLALCGASTYNIFYYMSKEQKKNLYILFDEQKLAQLDPYWYRMYLIHRRYAAEFLRNGLSSQIIKIGEDSDRIFKNIKEYKFKRIWLITASWARDGNLTPYEKEVRKWMEDNYLVLDRKEFDGIFVDLYCKKELNER